MTSELAAVTYGLLCALCWGAGDFSGGMATRKSHVYSVIFVADIIGAVLLAAVALWAGEPIPGVATWVWGASAGLAGVIGLVALYRALASSQMGLASPLSAVIAAIVPVGLSLMLEGTPGVLKLSGFALALIAVWFITQSGEVRFSWAGLQLPLVAGLGFGGFFILIDRVGAGEVFWPLFAARLVGILVMGILAKSARQPFFPTTNALPLVVLVGVLDTIANVFYTLAAQSGRLDVAAVLSSLYPAATVWLAWLILKERFSTQQLAGVAAALVAIVLIAF